ncbi:3',5'-cyclic nucleotide phosphodiesterase [Skeletonema marinoi]|uniref:3',5'-cyclic nucleotide phosphodiesterase n=2 Tax=Skeletonema marinoi TaxID=267567 RepID=A0AAD8Y3Q3_9STRA|nr:3',5'-cyclic nucleotide phosphodiesterase [Skeletonema marinoi]
MSGSNNNNNNNSPPPTTPHQHDHWQPWPPSALSMARTALSLTTQPWAQTGRGPVSGHPSILSPPSFISNAASASSTANNNNSIVDEITERMVSLLLIRIVALVTCRLGNMAVQQTNNNSGDDDNKDNGHRNHRRASNESTTSSKNDSGGGYRRMKDKMYVDYSTSTICRSALKTAKEEGKRIRTQQQQVGEPAINNDELTDDNEHDDDGDTVSKSLHVRVGNQKYNLDNDGDEKMAAAEDNDEPHDATPMTTLRQYSSEPKSYSITINTSRRSSINHHSSTSSTNKSSTISGLFPKCITPQIIHQLRTYVHTICSQYHSPHRVPYHNVEHAYHVFLSANKLLDLMLCEHTDDKEDQLLLAEDEEEDEGGAQQQLQSLQSPESKSSTPKHNNNNNNPRPKFRRATLDSLLDHRPTYGIKSDPLTQLAFLFSALVHDVDHTGISNRQLVLESDDLAILYNDQSVAEQRSLAIAFSVLKRGEFDELRRVLFETTGGGGGDASGGGGGTPAAVGGGAGENEDWFKFRKLVIDLVLVTDIASPERTQIVKSKWKEAFGEVIVAEKMKEKSSRLGRGGKKLVPGECVGGGGGGGESLARGQQVGSGSRGEGNNNNTTPAGGDDGTVKAVTRKVRRASLESTGRMGSQRSILTADISLSSKSLDVKDGCDNDDNDSTDARSIDISESSSISDIQSLDDDFDASAVSRTKMNFDPNVSGDTSLASSGNGNPKLQQQQQQQPSPNKMASIGPRDQLARMGPRGRRSTGDLADLSEAIPEEISDPPSRSRGRSKDSSKPLNKRRSTFAIRGRLSRSMTTPTPRARSEERRLGVRRALDLAGSTIVAYNNSRSSLRSSGGSDDPDIDFDEDDDWDEIDEFKATVVLEQMIRAADVAALLQDWTNVMKWSTRLYKELKNGFLSDRGEDPAIGWYDNQIKFFDFYIKPLAKNLGVMGVFDEKVGHSFVHLVKSNLARWIEDGELATVMMIRQDEKERGNKEGSGIARIDESESSKSSLDKSIESLGLGNAVAEVKLSALSASSTSLNSDTLSGLPGNNLDEGEYRSCRRDSFNSASTASTTNQSSTRLTAQPQHDGDE